jgi:hypothetical protein
MVEGATGTALEVFERGQAEEQECLFYVALSRARDRLFIYAPRQKSNGHNRPLSPFLDRLGSSLARLPVIPTRNLPDAPEAADIPLAIDGGLRFGAAQIALYESCPRRFFYTHVLQIGGRRTATPFMQMHEAVRSVFQAVIDGAAADGATIEQLIEKALVAEGLAEHGYVGEFRVFATAMVRYFASTREGLTAETATALSLTLGGEQIIVEPDDVLVHPDGRRILRRVRTGHQRSTETTDVGAAAFVLAAQEVFPGAAVELVHLADGAVTPLGFKKGPLETRREKLLGFLNSIRAGHFPAKASPRTCPGCPAFFVCGATPGGVLPKKF